MAPPPSNSSWVVLDRDVPIGAELPEEEAAKWKAVSWNGDLVVGGLTLLSRFEPPPGLSALRIQLSDDVVKANWRSLYALLRTTGKGLAIIDVSVGPGPDNKYYLVCDAAASSLTVIPGLTSSNTGFGGLKTWPSCSMGHIPTKRGDGCQAIVALTHHRDLGVPVDLVFLWQLSPSSISWECKTPIFPKHPQFCARTFFSYDVFSWQGMCFWVDVLQGSLYCYHDDLLSGGNDVQFHFIELPPGCTPDPDDMTDMLDYPPRMYRSMACVGGSIKFVTIGDLYKSSTDSKAADPRRRVTLWTLKPDLQQWEKDHEFHLGHLCRFRTLHCSCDLTNPVLSAEDPDVMYLVVHDFNVDVNDQVIVCIGVHDGRVKSSCRSPSFGDLNGPKLTGSSFFECRDSQCLTPLKRKSVYM